MKNVLSILLTLAIAISFIAAIPADNDNPIANAGMAKFKWDKTTHDFGKIEENLPVEHKFAFTNNGKSPLIISNVRPSCGCTVTEYTKEPVPPGKKGFVKATYDTKRVGIFNKSIRVTANIEGGTEMLMIKGEVVPEAEAIESN
jgi:hypothetical protein